MKNIKVFALFVTILLSLSACGSKDASGDNDTAATVQKNVSIAETESDAKEETQIAVEDFELTKIDSSGVWFKVKIRNICDADLEEIMFDYQALDKNGDILCDQTCGASNLAAGQAIWVAYWIHALSNVEDAAAVCFVSSPSWMNSRTPLKEKVVFQLEDYR